MPLTSPKPSSPPPPPAPEKVRHLSTNPWQSSDVGVCGARRNDAAGICVVKNQKQTNCPACLAIVAKRVAGVRPKGGLLS